MGDLLRKREVAARLTVSERTVERLIHEGRIRVTRPSPGIVRIEQREVEAYLAAARRSA